MTPSDNIIAFQSALRASVLVNCFCPLSHGKNCPIFLNLRKDKLCSRWKTGLQLSGQGGASAHTRMGLRFVVQNVATTPRLDKDPFDHERETTFDNESQSNEPQRRSSQISLEDLKERDPKEYNRRLGISKANKGRTPWNKGRKHSPETIERIRERTKQAMQDPKVKKKLQKCGHPQSEETRIKIQMSMKRRIDRQRKEKQLQDSDLLEWKESIAEAARKGGDGEEELQWNSYEILVEKMHHETMKAKHWKISQAIKAKWADPEYRKRNIQSKLKEGRRKEK